MGGNRITGAKHLMTDRRLDSVQCNSRAGNDDLRLKLKHKIVDANTLVLILIRDSQ